VSGALLPLAALAEHSHTGTGEWLSTALWAGLAVLFGAGLVVALLVARALARKSAARSRPCPECGRFVDSADGDVCPSCGHRLERPAPEARESRGPRE
jgi:hypothetical protein